MKWCLLAAIYLYRRLPVRFKRQCLFKETCSVFVARIARESGSWPALRGLATRLSQCRPGYTVYFDNRLRDWQVRLVSGDVADASCIADVILEPYRDLHLARAADCLSRALNCQTDT